MTRVGAQQSSYSVAAVQLKNASRMPVRGFARARQVKESRFPAPSPAAAARRALRGAAGVTHPKPHHRMQASTPPKKASKARPDPTEAARTAYSLRQRRLPP